MAPALRQWICPVCKTKVTKSHYSLLCGGCSNYFHPHCVNIQESVLRLNKTFKYVCKQCEGKGGSVRQRNRESNSAGNLSNLNDGQSKGTDYQKDDSVCRRSNGSGSDVITRMDCSKAVNDASARNNIDNNGNNMTVTNSADAGRSGDSGGDAGGCGSVDRCDVTAGGSGINNSGIPMNNANDDCFGNLSVNLKNQLREQQKELNDQIAKCTESFEAKIDQLVNQLRTEFLGYIQEVRAEIKNCHDEVAKVANDVQDQLKEMERRNQILQRRLYRNDFVINGLPRGIRDIMLPVLKIASLCNVQLNSSDIQHCCYFSGGKSILVKLNSTRLRDQIMANYHRRPPIRLGDVEDNDVRSRIFLNDHLTPDASKLVYMLRKLRERNIIAKYNFINGDIPRASLTFTDGFVKTVYRQDCELLLQRSSDPGHLFSPIEA